MQGLYELTRTGWSPVGAGRGPVSGSAAQTRRSEESSATLWATTAERKPGWKWPKGVHQMPVGRMDHANTKSAALRAGHEETPGGGG